MNYKFKTKPYKHQLTALEKSVDKKEYGYFMEMGTGKSKVLVDNMAILYDKGKINGALIIAPKGVYNNWYSQEIPTHLASHIKPKMVMWTASASKAKEKEYQTLFETGFDLHVLIMNVEAFSTDKGLNFAKKFLRTHNTLMAVDESTTIKNPKAQRTRNILDLRALTKYRRIMTGSPITKNPLDLFTQCYFLDPFLLDQSSYYVFRTRYAVCRKINVSGRSVEIVVGYRNLGELSEKLKPFSYRVLKDDCLDLPEKTFIKRIVQLSPDQQKLYQQMKEKALAILNGKMVSTTTVMTQLMRLQQITCGHFTADDGSTQEIPNNRITELLDVLNEIEGKVVIWGNWQKDMTQIIKAIAKEYGQGSVVDYYGLTPKEERQKHIEKFQNDPKCRFFVGTPATGGFGITLTAASNMIYYSNGYNLEFRTQSEARIDRIGQKYPMTYIDIICEKTVDERIVKALRNKINIASKVMGEELKDWI